MKRIFKLLAVAMAFVLTLSVLTPHVSAEAAAKKPKLNKVTKTLYVGGSSVKKSLTNTYKFKVNNKPSSYSASWSVDKPELVTIKKLSGGRCTATANTEGKVGKATITCTFKDKKANVVYKLQAVVTVKRNASNVKVTYSGSLADLKVGDTVQMKASMLDKNNKTLTAGTNVTDTIKWNSSNTNAATVSSDGLVTVKGAGTATITCYTVQDTSGTYSKMSKATSKATVIINVKGGIGEVKQTTLNKLQVTFGEDVSKKLTTNNISIKTKSSSVTMPVKSVEFDKTGTIATITTSSEFPDGVTYVVTYDDSSKEFTSSKGSVAKMEIMTDNGNIAVVGVQTPLRFKLYDSTGVDITPTNTSSSAYLAYSSRITYELVTSGAYGLVGSDIIFALENETASVKATYHTYRLDSNGNEIGSIAVTSRITSVSEAATIALDGATIISKATAGKNIDFAAAGGLEIAMGDMGYYLVVRAKDAAGNYVYSNDTNSKFDFSSSNNGVLIVYKTGEIFPLSRGTATVSVSYGGKVIGTYTVQVVDTRKVAQIVFTMDGEVKNTAIISSAVGDGLADLRVKVTAKDQYQRDISIASANDVTVDPTSTFSPVPTKYIDSNGDLYITLSGASWGSDSGTTYSYRVTYGSCTSGFNVVVRNPIATASSSYKIVLTGDTDLAVPNANGSLPSITVSLFEQKNGVNYRKIDSVWPDIYASGTDTFYYTVVNPNGSRITDSNVLGFSKINTAAANSNDVLTKLTAGTYTITVYRKLSAGSTQVASTRFTLTDKQADVKAERIKEKTNMAISSGMSTSQMVSVLLDCYRITIGDEVINNAYDITFVNPAARTNLLVVTDIEILKRVSVTEGDKKTYYLKYVIPIRSAIESVY